MKKSHLVAPAVLAAILAAGPSSAQMGFPGGGGPPPDMGGFPGGFDGPPAGQQRTTGGSAGAATGTSGAATGAPAGGAAAGAAGTAAPPTGANAATGAGAGTAGQGATRQGGARRQGSGAPGAGAQGAAGGQPGQAGAAAQGAAAGQPGTAAQGAASPQGAAPNARTPSPGAGAAAGSGAAQSAPGAGQGRGAGQAQGAAQGAAQGQAPSQGQGGGSGQGGAQGQGQRGGSTQRGATTEGGGLIGVVATTEIPLTTKIAGRLTPASSIAHPASAAGTVASIFVKVGEPVVAGSRLFSVVRDDLTGSFVPAVVTARIAGVVSSISVKVDASVKSGDAGVTIIDGRTLYLKALLSDKDAMAVKTGVAVEALATDGTKLRGTLIARSPEPDYTTGLFTATIEFASILSSFPGQYVTAELPVGAVRGIFVQQDLLQRMYGRYQLWVVDAQGLLEARRVSIGAIYGDRVLITEGLQVGDRILLKRTGKERAGQSATGTGS